MNWWVVSIYYLPDSGKIIMGIEEDRYPHLKGMQNGKRIITWNIDYCDEDELKKANLDYYREYLPVIKQQNKMIIIFAKISEILEKQGIDLKIYEVNFSENS